MKAGDKVSYYEIKSRAGKEVVKQGSGTLLSISEIACRVLPEGKDSSITLPLNQVSLAI